MAQRIATEYKQILLELTSQQLQEFMNLFKGKNNATEVRVYENGDTEFILFDDGNEIPLAFRNIGLSFYFEGSYTIKDVQLAHTMRQAIRVFKGSAIVHRVYDSYIMEYHYQHGNVMKIIEKKDNGSAALIYEYHDTVGDLTRLFAEQGVEDQISWVKLQIDMLLDQRCNVNSLDVIRSIDAKLDELSHDLFVLEA
jgi:hypothetical protein